MMQYNTVKHDPNKKFTIDARQGTPYPFHEMEQVHVCSDDTMSDGAQFKMHNFYKYRKKVKRVRCNPTMGGVDTTE